MGVCGRLSSRTALDGSKNILYLAIFTPPSGKLHPGGADEAPSMFYRNGYYYIMFGHGCCFCEGGSGLSVFTVTSPLGPYTSSDVSYDIACKPNEDIGKCHAVTNAQQNDVFQLPYGTFLWE